MENNKISEYRDLDTLLDTMLDVVHDLPRDVSREIILEITRGEADKFQEDIVEWTSLFTPRIFEEKPMIKADTLYMGPQGIKVTLKIKEDVV
jgi:hypothetical protein